MGEENVAPLAGRRHFTDLFSKQKRVRHYPVKVRHVSTSKLTRVVHCSNPETCGVVSPGLGRFEL